IPGSPGPNVGKQELRGIPDGCVFQGEYKDPGGYTALLRTYMDALTFWHFKARDLTSPQATIISVDGAGNVETLDNMVLDPGNRVRVLRSTDTDGNRVGGLFTVDTFT